VDPILARFSLARFSRFAQRLRALLQQWSFQAMHYVVGRVKRGKDLLLLL
jgi:hypothetical protein